MCNKLAIGTNISILRKQQFFESRDFIHHDINTTAADANVCLSGVFQSYEFVVTIVLEVRKIKMQHLFNYLFK